MTVFENNIKDPLTAPKDQNSTEKKTQLFDQNTFILASNDYFIPFPDQADIEDALDDCYGQSTKNKRFCVLAKKDYSSFIQATYQIDHAEEDCWYLECQIASKNEIFQHSYAVIPNAKSRQTAFINQMTLIKTAFASFLKNKGDHFPKINLEWHKLDHETHITNNAIKWDNDAPDIFCTPDALFDQGMGCREKEEASQAVIWWRKAARMGHGRAQCFLASAYYTGYGCRKNFEKFIYWEKQAANNGIITSQYHLGRAHYYGEKVNQDIPIAYQYITKAVKAGSPRAMNALAYICLNHPTLTYEGNIVDLLEQSASQGIQAALLNLGDLYYWGYKNIPIDYEQAFKYFQKASKSQSLHARSIAKIYLAFMTHYAMVKKPIEKKTKKIKVDAFKAIQIPPFYPDPTKQLLVYQDQVIINAQAGHSKDQYQLGCFYLKGTIGIKQNKKRAIYWFQKAAEQQNADAMNALLSPSLLNTSKQHRINILRLSIPNLQKGDLQTILNIARLLSQNTDSFDHLAISYALYRSALSHQMDLLEEFHNFCKRLDKKTGRRLLKKPSLSLEETIKKIQKMVKLHLHTKSNTP